MKSKQLKNKSVEITPFENSTEKTSLINKTVFSKVIINENAISPNQKKGGLINQTSIYSNYKKILPNLKNPNNAQNINTEDPLTEYQSPQIKSKIDKSTGKIHSVMNNLYIKNNPFITSNKKEINEQSKEGDENYFIITKNNDEKYQSKKIKSNADLLVVHKNLASSVNIKEYENLKMNSKNTSRILKNQNELFCPYCEHCNKLSDTNLDKHIYSIKEAKIILNKGVNFIANSGFIGKEKLDLFMINHSPDSSDKSNKEKSTINYQIDSKTQVKDVDSFINVVPKATTNNRLTYTVIHSFLNALIENKVTLENILSQDSLKKFKESFFSNGFSFLEENKRLEFDRELESIFDTESIKKIKKFYVKKIINFGNESKTTIEKKKYENLRKKFLVLFLVFIQILSEISSECKERAILLYKFFKLYFIEQEKKWVSEIEKMREKIQNYKNLIKLIFQQKTKHIDKVEAINEVLFSQKLTNENLQLHKKLIQDLLSLINEKREELYLKQTELEILDKDIKFWIYDYDNLKINAEIRKKMADVNSNLSNIVSNIELQMSHKYLSKEDKSLLVNADRYQIVSGHNGYLHDQKVQLVNENERLNNLNSKNCNKKKEWKNKYFQMEDEYKRKIFKLETDLTNFKNKDIILRIDIGTQTDIDILQMKKIIMNHESVNFFKSHKNNKLSDYLDRIKFNISHAKPISKKSILLFIPEILNEKIASDFKNEIEKKNKVQLDILFVDIMKSKFKLKKFVKKHCEETILSIQKYAAEDDRIESFGKFLGVLDVRYRNEVLDIYLSLIKALPFSIYKVYEETEHPLLITTHQCFEIYFSKFKEFQLIKENKDNLLRISTLYEDEKELKIVDKETKFYIFNLSRFLSKSNYFIHEIIVDFSQNKRKTIYFSELYQLFCSVINDLEVPEHEFLKLVTRLLKYDINNKTIDLESIIDFHDQKLILKMKVQEFLEMSLKSVINLFSLLEKVINNIFDQYDVKRNEIMFFKEFQICLIQTLKINENEWKINQYFQNALNGQSKEYITKEEFIVFCLNESDVVIELMKFK